MVKESIINLKKALSNSLQTVPNLIEVLKRGLDGVETAAEEQSTYSTDERVVGKWIDGSDIYEKSFEITQLPNNTSRATAHGIENLGNILSITATLNRDAGNYMIPTIFNDGKVATLYVTTNSIVIYSDRNISDSNKANVTLRYIKISASRSPEENDTKNDGDEEKNTNER